MVERKPEEVPVMSSKTKIIVLHKKEVLYTAIFAVFGIIILFLLFFMFSSGRKQKNHSLPAMKYVAGVYSSQIKLGEQTVNVEVTVDDNHINSITLTNLSDTVSAMYPLIQPSLEELRDQILETQSLENITCPADSQYTSMLLLDAIEDALKKALPGNDNSPGASY